MSAIPPMSTMRRITTLQKSLVAAFIILSKRTWSHVFPVLV